MLLFGCWEQNRTHIFARIAIMREGWVEDDYLILFDAQLTRTCSGQLHIC